MRNMPRHLCGINRTNELRRLCGSEGTAKDTNCNLLESDRTIARSSDLQCNEAQNVYFLDSSHSCDIAQLVKGRQQNHSLNILFSFHRPSTTSCISSVAARSNELERQSSFRNGTTDLLDVIVPGQQISSISVWDGSYPR